jgi:hypothetical protein
MDHKPLSELLVLQTAVEYLLKQGDIQLSEDFFNQSTPAGSQAKASGLVPQTGDWNAPGRWVRPSAVEATPQTSDLGNPPPADITSTEQPAVTPPETQQGEEEEVDFDDAYDPDDEDYDEEADFDEEAAGVTKAQYDSIVQTDGLNGAAQSEGWGSDIEVEDDHFSPEGGQNGPQGYAHELQEYAKQVQEGLGIPIIGGPTGNEPANEVYEHYGYENGHMGGNPITLTHIKDYIEAKGGKAPDAPWEVISTEKSHDLSKLLVLETALEFMQDSSQGFLLQKSVDNVVKVGDVDIPVELALDPVKGLSGRGSMNPGTGMLFSMLNARDFWMKDMKFPLDIVWINDKHEVVDITENLPVPTSSFMPLYSPRRLSTYALEINGGEAKALGINIGDAVEINIS